MRPPVLGIVLLLAAPPSALQAAEPAGPLWAAAFAPKLQLMEVGGRVRNSAAAPFFSYVAERQRRPPEPAPEPSIRDMVREWRKRVLADIGASLPSRPNMPSFEFPISAAAFLAVGAVALLVCYFLIAFIVLKCRAVLTDLRLALAERRSKLISILPRTRHATGQLSLTEIKQVLDVLPEIPSATKADLIQLLSARAEEK
jgi:hypothetical protein